MSTQPTGPKPAPMLAAITDRTFTNSQIDQIFDMVVSGPKQQNPTMTEATFRDYFLPVLSGALDDPERLRIYVQGVAGPNIGVNVVDEQGMFLFEVPPLFGTDHIKVVPDDKNAVTFGTIVDSVELMRFRSPTQAARMFRLGMYQRILKSTTKNYQPTANEAKWLAIFKRYGIEIANPGILTDENKEKHANNATEPAGIDTTLPVAPTNDFETIQEY